MKLLWAGKREEYHNLLEVKLVDGPSTCQDSPYIYIASNVRIWLSLVPMNWVEPRQ
jgi:hypothetical protein